MAHRRQEARLGQIGALGAPARLVRIELGLLEFGDQRVLFRLERNVLRRGGVQAAGDDQEIADDADRQGRRRQRRPVETGGVEDDHANDHRQHAGDERRRNGRRQKRHHGRDQEHHDNGERVRVRVARLEQRDDEIGPGRAAERGGQHELAPPRAGGLLLFAAVEKRDRQRIADRDRAGDQRNPGRQRSGVDPRQRGRADAERDDPEHRRGAAVDLGEQPHHRRRMTRDRIRLGERPPRFAKPDGHLAPARGRVGVAFVPAPR